MADKSKLTVADIERLRGELNIEVATAIQKFESSTGIRVGYIDTVRESDKGRNCICPQACCDSNDVGDVSAVNISINMGF